MSLSRRPLGVLAATAVALAPAASRAGTLSLAASVGTGYRTSPDAGRIPTSIMLAPGIDVLDDLLRVEVGFVGDLPDVAASRFDVQVRPMAVVTVPVVPIYGRLVAGVTRILHGPVSVAFGAAVGLRAGLGELVGLFAEAGYVPRANADRLESVVEGRVGIVLGG